MQENSALGSWEKVAVGVWQLVVEPTGVNSVLIAGETECALVGAGPTPQLGAAIRTAVATCCEQPLTTLVIPHSLPDYWGGAQAFADLRIVGHETLSKLCDQPTAQLSEPGSKLVRPTQSFSMGMPLELGNRFVEVVHYNAACTVADAWISLPHDDVIFLGELLGNPELVGFANAIDKSAWPKNLGAAIQTMTATTVIIPGHGKVMDLNQAIDQHRWIVDQLNPPRPEPTLSLSITPVQ